MWQVLRTGCWRRAPADVLAQISWSRHASATVQVFTNLCKKEPWCRQRLFVPRATDDNVTQLSSLPSATAQVICNALVHTAMGHGSRAPVSQLAKNYEKKSRRVVVNRFDVRLKTQIKIRSGARVRRFFKRPPTVSNATVAVGNFNETKTGRANRQGRIWQEGSGRKLG